MWSAAGLCKNSIIYKFDHFYHPDRLVAFPYSERNHVSSCGATSRITPSDSTTAIGCPGWLTDWQVTLSRNIRLCFWWAELRIWQSKMCYSQHATLFQQHLFHLTVRKLNFLSLTCVLYSLRNMALMKWRCCWKDQKSRLKNVSWMSYWNAFPLASRTHLHDYTESVFPLLHRTL